MRRKRLITTSAVVYTCLIYLFLFLPIMMVVIFSFNSARMSVLFEHFSFKWYTKILDNDALIAAFKNTIEIAVVSTALATIIGTLAAVGMYKYNFRGKFIVDALLYVAVVIPEIVLGIALLSFFSLLGIKAGLGTLILAHTTFCLPFVVLTVRARMSGFDLSLEEAAMDLGANRKKTFFKITLPLIMPGIMAGAMLAFTLSIDDIIISFFTAGPEQTTYPIKVFSMMRMGITPDVNALSTMILLFTILIVSASQLNGARKKK